MTEFASNGKANAGLTTGIIGTAGFGATLLTNLLGNWMNNCAKGHSGQTRVEDTGVSHYELAQSEIIGKLQSEIALRDANIYNDQKTVEVYKDLSGRINALETKMYEQDKALAVSNAKIEGTFAVLGEKLNAQRNEFMCALNRERDERCCGDNTIVNYTNATFYAKQVADVTTGTTVTAQTTYNPLFNCGKCC